VTSTPAGTLSGGSPIVVYSTRRLGVLRDRDAVGELTGTRAHDPQGIEREAPAAPVLVHPRSGQSAPVAAAAQHARADQHGVHLGARDVLRRCARLEPRGRVRIGGRAIIGGEREVGDHVRARAIVVLEPARTQGRRQVLRTKALLVVTIR
jgi:hypothetical protein